jgi:hypothetical protein
MDASPRNSVENTAKSRPSTAHSLPDRHRNQFRIQHLRRLATILLRSNSISTQFLKNVLPVLLELVTRNQQPQIVYLCIKFLWKAIHYEINNDTKLLACGWMPLILAIINATNPTHDANPE